MIFNKVGEIKEIYRGGKINFICRRILYCLEFDGSVYYKYIVNI